MVHCSKYKQELEGLDEPPFDSDFGHKIYQQRLEAGVGRVDRASKDAAKRIPPAAVDARVAGVSGGADESVFLRRGRCAAEGVCSAVGSLTGPRNGQSVLHGQSFRRRLASEKGGEASRPFVTGSEYAFVTSNLIRFLVTRLPSWWQHVWPVVHPCFSQGRGSLRMPGKDLTLTRTAVSASRAAFFAVIAMLAVTQLSAQSTSTYTEYAAKILCGVPTGTLLTHDAVGNAEYTTSINIHNPNLFTTDQPISFLKKAVRTREEGDTPTPPSAFGRDSLPERLCGVR